ncbi:MAG: hypothetical protein IJH14_06925 [Solobacterium sp.]|nr:hypothetical protein [Solobacterium sp.]
MALIARKQLTEEEMKDVSGGAFFIYQGADINGGYTEVEVIDDVSGEVIKTFYNDIHGAERYAREIGMSIDVLTWPQLKKLREDYKNNQE